MKFEKFLLDDYKQTPQGKKVYSFFADLKHIYFHDRKKLYNFVDSMLDVPCAKIFLSLDCESLDTREFGTIDEYVTEAKKDFSSWTNYEARKCQSNIPCFSVIEFLEHPNYAFPYLFQHMCNSQDIETT